jgi:hypothetical protein
LHGQIVRGLSYFKAFLRSKEDKLEYPAYPVRLEAKKPA